MRFFDLTELFFLCKLVRVTRTGYPQMTTYFNPSDLVIKAFCQHLRESYHAVYGNSNPDYPDILAWAGSMALVRGSLCVYFLSFQLFTEL